MSGVAGCHSMNGDIVACVWMVERFAPVSQRALGTVTTFIITRLESEDVMNKEEKCQISPADP